MIFIGSEDDVSHLGYIVGVCPNCHVTGTFTVYFSKRKLTFMILLKVPMADDLVAECTHCGHRMAIPDAHRRDIRERLITTEQLAEMAANQATTTMARPIPSRTGPKTAYQILQVDPDADPEVIQAAFKRLAMKHHPDRSDDANADERMRQLTEAHRLLSDPNTRRLYDSSIGIVRPEPVPPAMRADDV